LSYRRSVMVYRREPGSAARKFPMADTPIAERATPKEASPS
jgi:hypothetical protein